MRLRTYIIDAFVRDGQPGTGNAAGVVLLPSVVSNNDDDAPTSNSTTSDKPLSLDNAARQRLAAELRQTETAFVERRSADKEEKGRFLLRWFTPTTEVPLCGHATLAAAAALFAEGVEGSKEEEEEEQGEGNATTRDLVYCFETVSSGLLKVRVRFPPAAPPRSLSSSPAFELDLPSRQPNASLPFGPSGGGDRKVALLRALQGRGTRALEPSFAGLSFNAALRYLVVSLRDGGDVCAREVIEGLRPDLGALRAAVSRRGGDKDNDDDSNSSVSGVIVTAVGSEEGEETIFSRFFAPWMGIDEDPATGSAHAVLAPLWESLLDGRETQERREAGELPPRPPFRARQLSARGGELTASPLPRERRVLVSGRAAVALEGWSFSS